MSAVATLGRMSYARRCVLVLGTHRSGTSITTALVQALGYELGGPLLHVGDENPLGHFEHETVLAMHEGFLADVGLRWFDDDVPLAVADRRRRRRWTDEITDCFRDVAAGAERFAVKEPRMLHFLPLWRVALRRLDVHTSALVTLRHPAATARSLHRRNGLTLEHAERIWLRDTAAIRHHIGRMPHGVVRYAMLVSDPVGTMRAGWVAAGLPWPLGADTDGRLQMLVDPSLNRSAGGDDGDAPRATALFALIDADHSVRQWPMLRSVR